MRGTRGRSDSKRQAEELSLNYWRSLYAAKTFAAQLKAGSITFVLVTTSIPDRVVIDIDGSFSRRTLSSEPLVQVVGDVDDALFVEKIGVELWHGQLGVLDELNCRRQIAL